MIERRRPLPAGVFASQSVGRRSVSQVAAGAQCVKREASVSRYSLQKDARRCSRRVPNRHVPDGHVPDGKSLAARIVIAPVIGAFTGIARDRSRHGAAMPPMRVRRLQSPAWTSGTSRRRTHRKKFVTARSRCRRNRCVVRIWKEAGKGAASAGTSTDEPIRCRSGERRCSVDAKRENHSRAAQSAFQAAFSAMLKTAARPLK